jgi:hypothetical protein
MLVWQKYDFPLVWSGDPWWGAERLLWGEVKLPPGKFPLRSSWLRQESEATLQHGFLA